jgi:hypothetical protein
LVFGHHQVVIDHDRATLSLGWRKLEVPTSTLRVELESRRSAGTRVMLICESGDSVVKVAVLNAQEISEEDLARQIRSALRGPR